jgi:hypothetical protein
MSVYGTSKYKSCNKLHTSKTNLTTEAPVSTVKPFSADNTVLALVEPSAWKTNIICKCDLVTYTLSLRKERDATSINSARSKLTPHVSLSIACMCLRHIVVVDDTNYFFEGGQKVVLVNSTQSCFKLVENIYEGTTYFRTFESTFVRSSYVRKYEGTFLRRYFRAMYVYSCTRTRTRTFGIGYVYDRVCIRG